MFPTEKELLEMFKSLMKQMHNQFGKKLDSETEHIHVTMRDKEFRLMLFGNFEGWQKENIRLKQESDPKSSQLIYHLKRRQGA